MNKRSYVKIDKASSNEATPRWDVGSLLAVCSFQAAVGIAKFGEVIGCNLPEESPTLQLLYRQHSEAAAKLAHVKPATLQEVAMAYHKIARADTEQLITNQVNQSQWQSSQSKISQQ